MTFHIRIVRKLALALPKAKGYTPEHVGLMIDLDTPGELRSLALGRYGLHLLYIGKRRSWHWAWNLYRGAPTRYRASDIA